MRSNPEHQRLEAQAIAFEKSMFGKVFHAPVEQPRRILDIGCGTGRATTQLAAKYLDAHVIGVDLSPVPPIHENPGNVEYIQGDIKKLVSSNDDRFREGSFDYVFHRLLVLGMTDWPGYFDDVSKLLAPGGWVEAQEIDIHTKDGDDNAVGVVNPAVLEFVHLAALKGMDVRVGSRLRGLMETSGLVGLQEDVYWWPILPMPEKPETDVCSIDLTCRFLLMREVLADTSHYLQHTVCNDNALG